MRPKRKNKTTALPLSKRQKLIREFNKANSYEGRIREQEYQRQARYKGKYPTYHLAKKKPPARGASVCGVWG